MSNELIFCTCGRQVNHIDENCQYCQECDPVGKPVDKSTILEGDLHQAIARVLELQKFLRSLHPDVRKIINFGELLK